MAILMLHLLTALMDSRTGCTLTTTIHVLLSAMLRERSIGKMDISPIPPSSLQ
ncbi:hypothetical protein ANCCAN_12326 [Ancylostoma caninum]|uniref:Uncharacterized protein n=1 Tax=Ancylostoma caninum TaxID=29170 RepID=A0A368GBH1_ANCCA|nr:hypothetical protein ANCCAN_12326 [Ancylostoma caninum]